MNVVPPPHVPLASWLAHPSNQNLLKEMPHLQEIMTNNMYLQVHASERSE